ncbi:MAG: heavy-metal-associated domain-containing protein [Rhodobacteraceae bacterium]|nr:heavy-metal-associated domain-containing protein [Paracoccaceae bacterium]
MKLSIPEMSCGHCKAVVEQAIATAAPGATVAVDLAARSVTVTGAAAADPILAALAAEGYPATVAG